VAPQTPATKAICKSPESAAVETFAWERSSLGSNPAESPCEVGLTEVLFQPSESILPGIPVHNDGTKSALPGLCLPIRWPEACSGRDSKNCSTHDPENFRRRLCRIDGSEHRRRRVSTESFLCVTDQRVAEPGQAVVGPGRFPYANPDFLIGSDSFPTYTIRHQLGVQRPSVHAIIATTSPD
jgi:hypothetical protein